MRVAIPLAALAAEGSALPGLPRYDYVPLSGDATGFYAAAREFMAAWGKLGAPVVLLLAAGLLAVAAALVVAWRRWPAARPWLVPVGALAVVLAVTAAVTQMAPPGAAVFGWPLVWSAPMLPYRALGLPLDPDVAFGFGLALSLAANAVTVAATAYAGLYATGRRSLGLLAAALFAFWPFLTGLIRGESAWQNATWQVDVGLHLYTEPLSTALVAVGAAVLLRPRPAPVSVALAGVLFGVAASVKLTNGVLAALVLGLLAVRLGARRALPYLAGVAALVPVIGVYWPKGYASLFENPRSWPEDPFSPGYLARNWTESLLFTPRTLLVLVPLAVLGGFFLRSRFAVALVASWALVNPVFYSFYDVTPQHPRVIFASLPAVFVLWAAGAGALVTALRRRRRAPTPARPLGSAPRA